MTIRIFRTRDSSGSVSGGGAVVGDVVLQEPTAAGQFVVSAVNPNDNGFLYAGKNLPEPLFPDTDDGNAIVVSAPSSQDDLLSFSTVRTMHEDEAVVAALGVSGVEKLDGKITFETDRILIPAITAIFCERDPAVRYRVKFNAETVIISLAQPGERVFKRYIYLSRMGGYAVRNSYTPSTNDSLLICGCVVDKVFGIAGVRSMYAVYSDIVGQSVAMSTMMGKRAISFDFVYDATMDAIQNLAANRYKLSGRVLGFNINPQENFLRDRNVLPFTHVDSSASGATAINYEYYSFDPAKRLESTYHLKEVPAYPIAIDNPVNGTSSPATGYVILLFYAKNIKDRYFMLAPQKSYQSEQDALNDVAYYVANAVKPNFVSKNYTLLAAFVIFSDPANGTKQSFKSIPAGTFSIGSSGGGESNMVIPPAASMPDGSILVKGQNGMTFRQFSEEIDVSPMENFNYIETVGGTPTISDTYATIDFIKRYELKLGCFSLVNGQVADVEFEGQIVGGYEDQPLSNGRYVFYIDLFSQYGEGVAVRGMYHKQGDTDGIAYPVFDRQNGSRIRVTSLRSKTEGAHYFWFFYMHKIRW